MDSLDGILDRRSVVVMVEPVSFFCNEATCADNYFQNNDGVQAASATSSNAVAEHRAVLNALQARGVSSVLYRLSSEAGLGETPVDAEGVPLSAEAQLASLASKPDAIFPNNSISFHELTPAIIANIYGKAGVGFTPVGTVAVVLYPMCPGRRNEIPRSLLEKVRRSASVLVTPQFVGTSEDVFVTEGWSLSYTRLQDPPSDGSSIVLIDLRGFEDVLRLVTCGGVSAPAFLQDGAWWALEGTGSLNFSAKCDAVFATSSQRCHPIPFHALCDALEIDEGRRFLIPSAVDSDGRCIYHTNVVGWVGDGGLCGWCSDSLVFDPSAALVNSGATPSVLRSKVSGRSPFVSRGAFEEELAAAYGAKSDSACGFFKLSYSNLVGFAGNAMYLRSGDGVSYLAMSKAAADSLGPSVLGRINSSLAAVSKLSTDAIRDKHNALKDEPASLFPEFPHIIACPIPTIERLGGGSVRCLLAASLSATPAGHASLVALVAPVAASEQLP